MELVRLAVGMLRRDCSWMPIQISHGDHPSRIPQPTPNANNAEPKLSHRRTRIGGTERSAMAPKNKGDRRAAIADAAKAKGINHRRRAASRTAPIGTNQEPSDMPWRNSKAVSSIRSVRDKSRSIMDSFALVSSSSDAGRTPVFHRPFQSVLDGSQRDPSREQFGTVEYAV